MSSVSYLVSPAVGGRGDLIVEPGNRTKQIQLHQHGKTRVRLGRKVSKPADRHPYADLSSKEATIAVEESLA